MNDFWIFKKMKDILIFDLFLRIISKLYSYCQAFCSLYDTSSENIKNWVKSLFPLYVYDSL